MNGQMPEAGSATVAEPAASTPAPTEPVAPAAPPTESVEATATTEAPDEGEAASSGWFRACFVLCALLTLLPLWAVDFMPGIDLPQHMAQISLWQRFDAGIGRDVYWLNWFTPYLLGYSMVRALATFTAIETGFRIVYTGYVLALGLGMLAWVKALGRPRELALLAFPAAYGFPFLWGFFNFSVALPIALFFLAYGERHLRNPTVRSSVGLAFFSIFLFFGHVLVLAACGLLLGLRALIVRGVFRGVLAMLPATAGALLVPLWVAAVRSNHSGARHSDTWWEGFERVKQLPARMFGFEGDTWAIAMAWVLIGWGLLSLPLTPLRKQVRFLLPLLALAIYFAIPSYAMDTFFLAQRFGIVFTLVLIPALAWPRGKVTRAVALAAVVALTSGWAVLQLVRFRGFDEEARGVREVLAHADPDRSLMGLTYHHDSRHIPGTPFVHFPAYFQALRGGRQIGFSFAIFFPQLVRFRPGKESPMTPRLEWSPSHFNWNVDGRYDYFLVRSRNKPERKPFNGVRGRKLRLVAQSGDWWLFENDNLRTDRPMLPDDGAEPGRLRRLIQQAPAAPVRPRLRAPAD